MMLKTIKWLHRAKEHMKISIDERVAGALKDVERISLEEVDPEKLVNLTRRKNTYGDICQGFDVDTIKEFLAISANHVPTVILIMQQKTEQEGQVYIPPKFLDDGNTLHLTREF